MGDVADTRAVHHVTAGATVDMPYANEDKAEAVLIAEEVSTKTENGRTRVTAGASLEPSIAASESYQKSAIESFHEEGIITDIKSNADNWSNEDKLNKWMNKKEEAKSKGSDDSKVSSTTIFGFHPLVVAISALGTIAAIIGSLFYFTQN